MGAADACALDITAAAVDEFICETACNCGIICTCEVTCGIGCNCGIPCTSLLMVTVCGTTTLGGLETVAALDTTAVGCWLTALITGAICSAEILGLPGFFKSEIPS